MKTKEKKKGNSDDNPIDNHYNPSYIFFKLL